MKLSIVKIDTHSNHTKSARPCMDGHYKSLFLSLNINIVCSRKSRTYNNLRAPCSLFDMAGELREEYNHHSGNNSYHGASGGGQVYPARERSYGGRSMEMDDYNDTTGLGSYIDS